MPIAPISLFAMAAALAGAPQQVDGPKPNKPATAAKTVTQDPPAPVE